MLLNFKSSHCSGLSHNVLNQVHVSQSAWFLEIAFVRDVGMCVCVCVSAPKAINYIHMIFNLYNQLNKLVKMTKASFFAYSD